MTPIRYVIFDLDGTLLDTLDDLMDAVNFALSENGFPLRTREEIRAFVGHGVRNLMTRALPEGENTPDFERILGQFRAYYGEHSQDKTAPYGGILPLLDALGKKGIGTAVVSNKFDGAVKTLCAQYFGNRIPYALGEAEERGIRKKPAPDSVYEAMRLLSANPEETVYIGDSETDIETANNARLPCISVSWGFRDENCLKQNGADVIVRTPEELLSAIERGI